MTAATVREPGVRRWRPLVAIAASLLLIASPLSGLSPASAAPAGYPATGDTDYFDQYGGTYTLPLMTQGQEYTATLTGPKPVLDMIWCWSFDGNLPAGITMSSGAEDCGANVTFSGTPEEAGEFGFILWLNDGSDGPTYALGYSGEVESGKSPTATTLTVPAIGAHTGFSLSATVAGDPSVGHAPTGTVEFYASGSLLLGSATLVDGVAALTATVDKVNAGASPSITARYLGDDDYRPSTSAARNVLIYVPAASGTVRWNGVLIAGATVALLDGTDPTIVVDTDVTDADGAFEVSPGEIATTADVDELYYLRATLADSTVLFHKADGWNVTDVAGATASGPKTWKNYTTIDRRTPPVWTDSTLATPRIGAGYADGVTASSYNEMYYYVSDGELPDGLILSEETGEVTGTPLACAEAPCGYSFEITGTNNYGVITQQFSGTLLPAGVAPTWEDDEITGLRAGVAATEAVLAVGDPTITYAVTDGELPAGVTLVPSTGALTGTPTKAGPYAFTITAANVFGSVTAVFEGDVEAAPAIDLTLDFEAGTALEDAASTISAAGLQVGSTYTLTMFSTPRVLYTGTVGASGGFTWVVALPADTPPGAHRLLLTGVAADGTPMSAQAWFSLRSSGTIGAVSYAGPVGGLAATGVEAIDAALLGSLLLGLGIVLTVARRRRTA